ncbi:hypothetical protein P5766_23545 [Bacillus cereus]|uniref:hypothetical protein n=1 Tax=Bacillus cereus TaxID=1396 RepID=UPI000B0EBFE5|nr:hypothetical protein [Bacillus cereus]MDF9632629.1 hypothetical protein [Bacillus cereus]
MKQPTVLAAGAGYHLKAEAARLESLFYVMVALNGTRNYINDFSNISIITRNISTIFSLYRSLPAIYQRFFHYIDHYPQYINDFFIISIITRNISTIFSLYRSLPAIYQRFDKGYQFADKSRQYQRPSPLLLSIYYNLIYVKI